MSVPKELRSYGKGWRGKYDIVIHGGTEHRPDTPCVACDFLDRAEAAASLPERERTADGALREALERLEEIASWHLARAGFDKLDEVAEALEQARAALAVPSQEPDPRDYATHPMSQERASEPAELDVEGKASEALARAMAVSGYADPDPIEQWRLPDVTRILDELAESGYEIARAALEAAEPERPAAGLDPLLSSSDLPPLPWSSPADREPWLDGAGDPHRIVDANGKPLFRRNWKEACAAIEYLVRSANRSAAAQERPADAALPIALERLGLGDEQTLLLHEHLAKRHQTLAQWLGDVLMDYGLGRAPGREYPPSMTAAQPSPEPAEQPAEKGDSPDA